MSVEIMLHLYLLGSIQKIHGIHIDYAGPFMYKMYLVLVDAYSKWIEIREMPNINAPTTINELKNIFSIHGLPVILVSDNGTSFTSGEFKTFMDNNNIKHMFTPPYHPNSNGQAEREAQTFKTAMRTITDSKSYEVGIDEFLNRNIAI